MQIARMFVSLLVFFSVGVTSAAAPLSGVVRDESGAPVPEASVQLLAPGLAVIASGSTDAEGKFRIDSVSPGDYVLEVARAGLVSRRMLLEMSEAPSAVEIVLPVAPLYEEVTVTATPGAVNLSELTPQAVSLIPRTSIAERAKTVVAQVANEETGVAWQRTSPTISGIFVRGLTGNKVNVYMDGVRYSTGAARGGINTFLDLIDPTSIEKIEILRGPSTQYGSDSLGGSIQFQSPVPVFSSGAWHGTLATFFNSSDAGYGASQSASYSDGPFAFLVNLAGHRANTLRTGRGIDSRSAVTRFLGLPSSFVFDGRTPDTAFTQYGGLVRAYWQLGCDAQIIGHYQRSEQDGGKRWDQLMGGDGNLIADLRNFIMDLAYLRYRQGRLGWLENVSVTYSFNAQREERVNQKGNGNPLAAITHERERTRVHGLQFQGSRQINRRWSLYLGGEYYHERIAAPSYAYNPADGSVVIRRGRVPHNALYQNGGAWVQNIWEIAPGKFRLFGNLRYGGAAYESRSADSPRVEELPLWPDDSLSVSSTTFRVGAVATPVSGLNLVVSASRGFRAPHVTDLGTLGLTGSGFEVAAPDVAELGGVVGSTADADAESTGIPVEQVKPEISMTYEGGFRFGHSRVSGEVMAFVSDIDDNVTKQSLILPPGAVGEMLGDEVITSQDPTGVVYVAASSDPVLVRSNFDQARVVGVESRLDVNASSQWSFGGTFTWLEARDKRTDLAPNIEGGTPPPNGYFHVRYVHTGGRFWVEPYLYAADCQKRLSSLSLSDRRTGAGRSRSSIGKFFENGATARDLVQEGILVPTGETLERVQNRVLGTASSAPLYAKLNGYVTFNLRAGWQIGERQNLLVEFENIGDRNYRGMSWGVDAPGRGIYVRYSRSF